ncbi:family 43 glycosylhydrolase [Terriglobus albidus]|uniref:family 43 glycosylhydrolase n=1 Tax=Terriglobus albidus TaxID=1592106 RepID=UPI0021E0CC18|nr:family 43 glycosylhydrolase [Terriglobus albidus]
MMKRFWQPGKVATLIVLTVVPCAWTLDGVVNIHDPSTVIQSDGKYYVYGTGGGSLVSDDGWTWRQGARPARVGLAPDVIHIGDRYYMYVARNTGVTKGAVNMIWSKALDPASPNYKWEEGGVVASSDGVEESNAIDPGVFLDPNTGRLWLVYGSYFGFIRQVELDPKTGLRLHENEKPRDLAINCEASDMIYHDGWYYLLATHGSCCRGADSGYNIRVGRSRKVTGPFLDNMGIDMIQGGGKLLLGSESRLIGPGHFGLIDLGEGLQKFSLHYEADLERGGASVLDIRPLLWKDGWPVAGDNMKAGTFEIESARVGNALEMAVEGTPVGGRIVRQRPVGPPPAGGAPRPATGETPGPPPGGMFAGVGHVIEPQLATQVSSNWPSGNVDVRLSNFMSQAQQKWTISPAKGAGGYLGSPYFTIMIAGTERVLAATANDELTVVPAFTGVPEQLWRFDQLADGTWRIMPKSAQDAKNGMALTAVGSGGVTLAKFDASSDKQHWQVHLQ